MNLIYGMHEECPLDVMPEGWILQLVAIQHGPDEHPGLEKPSDNRPRIIRVQYSWGGEGQTFPDLVNLDGYVDRFISLVRNTPWAHVWIVGNEPNLPVEGLWPAIYVANIYNRIRAAVHLLPDHGNDQVLLPPIGPWNVESGHGWIEYFVGLIHLCNTIDGFALHTYCRSSNPEEITDAGLHMSPPWDKYYSSFLTYRDFMNAIPIRYKDKPVYITEWNEDGPWDDHNTGVVQAAYKEINRWNLGHSQQIRALILFRWPREGNDQYFIEGLGGVIEDFLLAQEKSYTWEDRMSEDRVLLNINCEDGFYDQDGIGELTVPVDMYVHWREAPGEGILDRVEADAKDAELGHPQVFEGRYSAALMWTYSTGQAALVSQLISVAPLLSISADAVFMFEAAEGWQGGARIGIVDGGADGIFSQGRYEWPVDKVDPFYDESIVWGEWESTYGNAHEKEWVTINVLDFYPRSRFVRLICQFNSDQAIPASGHFDIMTLYQERGTPPPDTPPGAPPDTPSPSPGSILEKLDTIELLTGEIRNQLLTGAIWCVPID